MATKTNNGKTVVVRHDKKLGADISLWYDTFGEDNAQPIILIQGLNAQAIFFPADFCEDLAKRGFKVYRVENRDIGLSTHLDNLGTHSICCLICCRCCVHENYTLEDMALDQAAFIDKMFKPEQKVHLLGASMGGMIAQHVVNFVPERIASLNLLFSSPGAKDLSEPSLKVKLAMGGAPRDNSRQAYIDHMLSLGEVAFYADPKEMQQNKEWLTNFFGSFYDRSNRTDQLTRHAAAVILQKDRSEICKKIKVPTNIIHGDCDVLVLPEHGKRLAALIPNSNYVEIKGFGHGFYPSHFEAINAPIARLAGVTPSSKNVEPVAE
jgi:pimeloyl-ACP methyl ester carboxylesterase